MKVFVRKEALRQILKWTRRTLFAGGILLIGYCAFVGMDAWLFQRRAARDLRGLQRDRRAASQITPEPVSATLPEAAPLDEGSLIGRIEIPRLALSVMVVQGDDKLSLRRAVGHIPGTALLGEDGNVGLAGHRDTFFRPLKDLKVHDEIQISTPAGDFRYQVVSLRIVDPENVGVLAPSGWERADAGNLLPLLLRRSGAQAMDREGEAGTVASGYISKCEMIEDGWLRPAAGE